MAKDTIKTKLNEIDAKLSKLTALFFSYHFAMMKLLEEKGITDRKEFGEFLEEGKKEYKKLSDDIDFMMIMKDFWTKRKRRRKGK